MTDKYRHPLHNRLWLFKRDRSPFWWTGFHHAGTYHRTSTKTKHQAEAEAFAADWYIEQQVQIRTGKAPVKRSTKLPTVKDASIVAINEYRLLAERGDRSPKYLKSLQRVMNKHIIPYFGDTAVVDISPVIWHRFTQQLYVDNPTMANATVHTIRNALAVCLNAAANAGWISESPRLKIRSVKNAPTKRIWFSPGEQEKLLAALDENIQILSDKPQWRGALELRDYCLFILYSGLRVWEAGALRFQDIRETKRDLLGTTINHILIDVNQGKRGTGTCNPDSKINSVYHSILNRRLPADPSEPLFKEHHRDMFNTVLKRAGLKHDVNGRKRDFVSLRHTYISNKILDKVPVYEIAHNCRTSPAMITKHYARHIIPELFTSLHAKSDAIVDSHMTGIGKAEDEISKVKDETISKIKQIVKMPEGKPVPDNYLSKGEASVNIDLASMVYKNPEAADAKKQIVKMIDEMAELLGMSVEEVAELIKNKD